MISRVTTLYYLECPIFNYKQNIQINKVYSTQSEKAVIKHCHWENSVDLLKKGFKSTILKIFKEWMKIISQVENHFSRTKGKHKNNVFVTQRDYKERLRCF